MPRVLTAMLVGAALAVAGATFQGLIRNPLADPYVLGTASGAALGAAIAVVLPVHFVVVEFGLLHGLAFAFALITAFVVVRLGGGGSGGLTRLLLTGYAVGSILAALLTMAMYVSGQNLREIFSFLLGGLAGSSWIRLAVATPIILVACVRDRLAAPASSTGCCSATRPPAISASTSAASAGSCSRWRRWPRPRRSRSAA